MLDEDSYIDVCEWLGIPAYQDEEHERNQWRLHSDPEIFINMAQRINSLENK